MIQSTSIIDSDAFLKYKYQNHHAIYCDRLCDGNAETASAIMI